MSGIAEYGRSPFRFMGSLRPDFHNIRVGLFSNSQHKWVSFCPQLGQHLFLFVLFTTATLAGLE